MKKNLHLNIITNNYYILGKGFKRMSSHLKAINSKNNYLLIALKQKEK